MSERHVEPEDRPPAEAGQPAAEDRPEDEPGADDHRVDAQRPAQLTARKGVGDERRRVGEQERAADALEYPRADQLDGISGQRAKHGCDGEHAEAQRVCSGSTEHVGQATSVEHEHGHDERVADDDPHEREQVGVQVAQDVGQRDDQRAGGQRGKQRADAGDQQDPPAVGVAGFSGLM